MRLQVTSHRIDLTADLKDFVARRIHFALGRFAGRIKALSVRLDDLNGPREGMDKCCAIRVNASAREDLERRPELDVLAQRVPHRAVGRARQLDGALDLLLLHVALDDEMEIDGTQALGIGLVAASDQLRPQALQWLSSLREDVDEIDRHAGREACRQDVDRRRARGLAAIQHELPLADPRVEALVLFPDKLRLDEEPTQCAEPRQAPSAPAGSSASLPSKTACTCARVCRR